MRIHADPDPNTDVHTGLETGKMFNNSFQIYTNPLPHLYYKLQKINRRSSNALKDKPSKTVSCEMLLELVHPSTERYSNQSLSIILVPYFCPRFHV
jgi:hypothetical protein